MNTDSVVAFSSRPKPRRGGARPRRQPAAWILGCALAGGLLVSGCRDSGAKAPPPPPTVQVLEAQATNVPMSVEVIGQLDSPQNVEMRARVEAFVAKVLFTEGSEVKEGDPLFALDTAPFDEQLAAAKGRLAQASAALNKYKADVARLKPLAEKKAVPLQDLDNAEASVAVGEADVFSAQAMVDSALLDLKYCDVRAPVSGLIGAKQVSVGELVGKADPTLLATISTLDPIWFYCAISEVSYLKAQAQADKSGRKVEDVPVTLVLADGSVHPEKGRFVFVDRAVDVKTGTLRLRAEFRNPEKLLRPGMFARIQIDLGTRPNSILVPERAVSELQGKNFVWVVGADNKVSQRPVQVGEQVGGQVLILEGLSAGERVIVEGVQKVRQDMTVQVVTSGPAEAPGAGAHGTAAATQE